MFVLSEKACVGKMGLKQQIKSRWKNLEVNPININKPKDKIINPKKVSANSSCLNKLLNL